MLLIFLILIVVICFCLSSTFGVVKLLQFSTSAYFLIEKSIYNCCFWEVKI